MAECNGCGRRFRIRHVFCSMCGARQFTVHGQPLDGREARSESERAHGRTTTIRSGVALDADEVGSGPDLLWPGGTAVGQEGRRASSSASSVSTQSGRNSWILAAGFGLFVLVAVVALGNGGTERSGADEAEALRAPDGSEPSTTTLPATSGSLAEDLEEADDLGALEEGAVPFDLVKSVSDGSVVTEQNADYVARTADGLTPLEAVGEEINYSLVVGIRAAPLFVDPNTGTNAAVPIGLEGASFLTETHAVQVAWGDGGSVVTARRLWAPDVEPVTLRESEPNVGFLPGPTSHQVWLMLGDVLERELVDLDSGEVLATRAITPWVQNLSYDTADVFSERGGGTYERSDGVVTKLANGFGLAASDSLLLVEECDDEANCTATWVDRRTLEPLDFPAMDAFYGMATIDPTSRWLLTQDYYVGETFLWEIATGAVVFGPIDVWGAAVFSPDGRWVLVDSGGTRLRIVHTQTGTEFALDPHAAESSALESPRFFPLGYASGGQS